MDKRKFVFLGLVVFVAIIILAFLNQRYPFFYFRGGPWSVGFTTTMNLEKFEIYERNIISYKYIDSIVPEKVSYIADPFFLYEDGQFFLFVEIKGQNNANIALLTSLYGKRFNYQGVVLDEDFHVSYPQVFKHNQEFFMLPETKGSNQVLLYKAENFPFNWTICDTLIRNRRLKDPTILITEERSLIVAADDDLRQHFFTSESLGGVWGEVENHEQKQGNETRPGGRFFMNDGHWYIPIQE